MGAKITRDVRSLAARLRKLVDDFTPELKQAGDVAADQIVITTLQGLAQGDVPFKPYSKSYQELIDAVGGKPSGVVDLRGIFVHAGKKEKTPKQISRNLLQKGGGRKSFVYITVAKGKKTILVRTRQTRARFGMNDKASEMSRDLITVVAEKQRVKLIYKPREKNYMIEHQKTRPWFSVNKAAVRNNVFETIKILFAARIAEFNAGR